MIVEIFGKYHCNQNREWMGLYYVWNAIAVMLAVISSDSGIIRLLLVLLFLLPIKN